MPPCPEVGSCLSGAAVTGFAMRSSHHQKRGPVRIPIRYKIVVPFVVLLVFVGVIGTGVATARLTNAAVSEFDSGLYRTGLLANDHLAILEADRLAELRAATDTLGVSTALAARDRAALTTLLVPLVANAEPTQLQIRVLDKGGQVLLAIDGRSTGPVVVPPTSSHFDGPAVQDAIAGRSDARGDRYVFVTVEGSRPVIFWAGPVRGDDQRSVGGVLVGEPLAEVAAGIPNAVFYDRAGAALAASSVAVPSLPASLRASVSGDHPVRVEEPLAGHAYGELFSDWTMRGQQLGYVAVVLNADQLEVAVGQVRLLLVIVFVAAALMTLLVGGGLAAHITRPLEDLVRSMRIVSAGKLGHRAPVAGRDEIGYLATTFNEMTASLEDKTKTLQDTYFASMEALARAIDARDPSTFGHSSRVAAISLEIADRMGLGANEREALRRGALLHDIGKIGVEDRVLRKPGPLNEQEAGEMREHPMIGYEMLRDLHFLEPSLPGIRHHHERWDGSGYPDALAASAIPLSVRILSVADTFDALTSDRPYRSGLSLEEAVGTIVDQKGKQFDPAVVDAFVSRADAIARMLRAMGRWLPAHPGGIGRYLEAS